MLGISKDILWKIGKQLDYLSLLKFSCSCQYLYYEVFNENFYQQYAAKNPSYYPLVPSWKESVKLWYKISTLWSSDLYYASLQIRNEGHECINLHSFHHMIKKYRNRYVTNIIKIWKNLFNIDSIDVYYDFVLDIFFIKGKNDLYRLKYFNNQWVTTTNQICPTHYYLQIIKNRKWNDVSQKFF